MLCFLRFTGSITVNLIEILITSQMHTQYFWYNVISTDFPMKSPVFFFAATVHWTDTADVFHLNDFWFAPPLPLGQIPLWTIPHPRAWRAGLVPGVAPGGGHGYRWNWTMHYINVHENVKKKKKRWKLTTKGILYWSPIQLLILPNRA